MKNIENHDFLFKIFVLRYQKTLLGNNSVYQKVLSIEGVFSICVEIFCLTVPKNFVRGRFCFIKVLVSNNFMDKRGKGKGGKEYHDFLSNFFGFKIQKYFLADHFRVSLFSGIEKIYDSRGYVTIFRRKCYVSQCQKFSNRSTDFGCWKFLGISSNFQHGSDSNRDSTAWETCCIKPTAVNFFGWKELEFLVWRKKKQPYRLENFSFSLHFK